MDGVAGLREEILAPAPPERHGDRLRGVLDSGNATRAVEERVTESTGSCGIERQPAHLHRDVQQMPPVIPEVERVDVSQAAYEQPRTDEENEGERALDDEERRAQPRAMIGALPGSGLERGGDVRPPGEQCRGDAREQSDEYRSARR